MVGTPQNAWWREAVPLRPVTISRPSGGRNGTEAFGAATGSGDRVSDEAVEVGGLAAIGGGTFIDPVGNKPQ